MVGEVSQPSKMYFIKKGLLSAGTFNSPIVVNDLILPGEHYFNHNLF